MPIPRLPDDVLSEILAHFFQPEKVSSPETPPSHSQGFYRRSSTSPPPPPTPVRGSTSLFLTSRRMRDLALPLFWRSITIHRPSDFLSLFAPKVGLLHAKGKVGVKRREWIRELKIGEEAVVPYDIAKIDKTFEEEGDVDPEREYDFHVKLSPVKLPNLRTLFLAVKKEINHQGNGDGTEDHSFSYLYSKIVDAGDARDRAQRDEDPDFELPEGMSEAEYNYYDTAFMMSEGETHTDFFESLALRNEEIVKSLLFPLGAQLRSLHLSLDGYSRATRNVWRNSREDPFDTRLPSTLTKAKDLVVTIHFISDIGTLAPTAATLAKQIPEDARILVETKNAGDRKCFVGSLKSWKGKNEFEKYPRWSLVEADGSLSLLSDLASGSGGVKASKHDDEDDALVHPVASSSTSS